MKYFVFVLGLAISLSTFSSCDSNGTNNASPTTTAPTQGTNNPHAPENPQAHTATSSGKPKDVATAYEQTSARVQQNPKEDLRASMSKKDFASLSSAELQMQLMRPIYGKIFDNDDQDDTEAIQNMTEGQKTLYFFRKIDEAMSSGGLKTLRATDASQYLTEASLLFEEKVKNEQLTKVAQEAVKDQMQKNGIPDPYNVGKVSQVDIEKFDKNYATNQDVFFKRLADYIKNNPEQFVKFTD